MQTVRTSEVFIPDPGSAPNKIETIGEPGELISDQRERTSSADAGQKQNSGRAD